MKQNARMKRFIKDVLKYTPFLKIISLLVVLWLIFSAGLFFSERGIEGTSITNYGQALYWTTAAFSTAGIADTPISGISKIIGGIWIVLGSALFFGTIVATITTYFMRPLHRPGKQIIDIIEYNLEQLDELSVEELDLLKETVDGLINHMEYLEEVQSAHIKKKCKE